MKRTMYYKTQWGVEQSPFKCQLANNKPHRPQVTVSLESRPGSDPIPYKEIDQIMHQTREGTFETLAEYMAHRLLGKCGVTKATVRVEEDSDFWVEVGLENEGAD